jgi:hypothetical protein
MDLAGITNEVVITNNAVDEVVIGTMLSSITMPANSTYYLAMWQDNTLWSAFSQDYLNPCASFIYGTNTSWPASMVPIEDTVWICAAPSLVALGCTAPVNTLSVGNHSTGGSSNNANLSKGAVAGIVIGCVIGTNLLLLACLMLVCGLSGKKTTAKHNNTSIERDASSRTELAHTEPSQMG